MIPSSELIALFRRALREKWGYIWGAAGETWTAQKQAAATREQTKKWGAQWIGRRVADCSGLFVWAYQQKGGSIYHGSNTIWREYTTAKGAMAGHSLTPGEAVFRTIGDDRHHIGLYVGGGRVIEARGTADGVVESSASGWDEWAKLKGIDYGEKGGEDGMVTVDGELPTLRKGDSGQAVQYMQELLIAAGYALPKYGADGKMGKESVDALMDFQDDRDLVIDGACGAETWAALKKAAADKVGAPAETVHVTMDKVAAEALLLALQTTLK